MARSGRFDEAILHILALEKRARLGGDIKTVKEAALVIVKLSLELKKWDALNSNITLLCKRRGQFNQVQVAVIQEAAEHVDGLIDKAEKLKLINTLRAVSEGKIFVEAERARLTYTLAKMKEEEGDIAGAAEVIQEENVETYGAMNKREKLDYLLEQIRLCLKKKDYIRAFIVQKKVDRKQLNDLELEDLKLRFYNILIEYYSHEKDSFELAKAYYAIYRTPCILKDQDKWIRELQATILYLCISPYDNHQIDMVHNLLTDTNLDQVVEYKSLLKHFVTQEIAQWPLPEHDIITQNKIISDGNSWTYLMLRDRIIQHDIRVVAGCYTRIRMPRLAEMLQLSKEDTEKYISDMVTSTSSERLVAKIDRPAEIVTFGAKQEPNDYLSDWSDNISQLLGLVEKTTHLIHKEVMLNKAKAAANKA